MTVTLESYIIPATVQNEEGNWHPGIKHGLRVYYWPRDVYATEMGASECATDMLAQITKEMNDSLGFGQKSIRELTSSSDEWA